MIIIDPSESDGLWQMKLAGKNKNFSVLHSEKTEWSVSGLDDSTEQLKYLQNTFPLICELTEVRMLIARDLIDKLDFEKGEDIVLIAPLNWQISAARSLAVELSEVIKGRVFLIWEPLFTLLPWIESTLRSGIKRGPVTTFCFRGRKYEMMLRKEAQINVFVIQSIGVVKSENVSELDQPRAASILAGWLYGEIPRSEMVKVSCPVRPAVKLKNGWVTLDKETGARGLSCKELTERRMISLMVGGLNEKFTSRDFVIPLGEIDCALPERRDSAMPLVLHWTQITRNRCRIALFPMEEKNDGTDFLMPSFVETIWAELPLTQLIA